MKALKFVAITLNAFKLIRIIIILNLEIIVQNANAIGNPKNIETEMQGQQVQPVGQYNSQQPQQQNFNQNQNQNYNQGFQQQNQNNYNNSNNSGNFQQQQQQNFNQQTFKSTPRSSNPPKAMLPVSKVFIFLFLFLLF